MKLRKLTSKHRSHCDTCDIQTQPCTHRDADTLGMFYSTPPNEIMIYVEFIFCGHLKWSEGSSGWHRHIHTLTQHMHLQAEASCVTQGWRTASGSLRPMDPLIPQLLGRTHTYTNAYSHTVVGSHAFTHNLPLSLLFFQYYYNILIRSWNEVKSKQHTLPLLLLLLPVNTFPLSVTSLPEET